MSILRIRYRSLHYASLIPKLWFAPAQKKVWWLILKDFLVLPVVYDCLIMGSSTLVSFPCVHLIMALELVSIIEAIWSHMIFLILAFWLAWNQNMLSQHNQEFLWKSPDPIFRGCMQGTGHTWKLWSYAHSEHVIMSIITHKWIVLFSEIDNHMLWTCHCVHTLHRT